jgi:hypothetical protein
MSQPSYPFSFYKFHNILSVYRSIQFFTISNSSSLSLLLQGHIQEQKPVNNCSKCRQPVTVHILSAP